MGLMLGRITVETPKYTLLKSTPCYQIRSYAPSLIAQVSYTDETDGFWALANFIFGKNTAQGKKTPEKVAMTAPVLTEPIREDISEKVAMTAPVLTEHKTESKLMSFVMPSKYTLDTLPTPVDSRVRILQKEGQTMAVLTFSGFGSEDSFKQQENILLKALETDNIQVTGTSVRGRYNPPWTVPFLRTNEIMVPVDYPLESKE
eukprot:TRINITY_DN3610_c0_g1_i5.p1 TRINITY_DN3610_c0_g1~~TRINITY_DN3610_c0_g1_i5.p1  ORF type:complete len:203 (+),score=22.08 TRINITY_DN3610_c0_g1_i5:92-700(+)